MWSRSPVCARPVRTLDRSVFSASTDFAIFCSADFLTSLIILPPSRAREPHFSPPRPGAAGRSSRGWRHPGGTRSAVDERALVLAEDDALQRTRLEDREHLEQHV